MSTGEAVVGRWHRPWGCQVWPRWVLACAVGGAGAASLAALAGWLGLALFGVAVALPQWLVLRRHLPDAWRWVPLTAIGFLTALPVAFIAGYVFLLSIGVGLGLVLLPDSAAAWTSNVGKEVLGVGLLAITPLLSGAAAGAVVGAVQQLLVRPVGQDATRWLVACLIGGALVAYPTLLVLQVASEQGILAGASVPPARPARVLASILAMALGGAVYGLITGSVLARLVPHSAPDGMSGLATTAPDQEP